MKEIRVKHNTITLNKEDYEGAIVRENPNSGTHSICAGKITGDGAAATRLYSHRHKGANTAYANSSYETLKPLVLVTSVLSTVVMIHPLIGIVYIVLHISLLYLTD